MKAILLKIHGLMLLALTLTAGTAAGQTPAPVAAPLTPPVTESAQQEPAQPRRPRKSPQPLARVTVVPSQAPVAPQVVTVVHRLSGVKVLRLLRRQAGATGVIERIDPSTLTTDAHASIIAGWALDDGRTVAARLPQAAAEIEILAFDAWLPFPAPPTGNTPSSFPFIRPRMEPDLTVITNDGKKFRARLVGLDATTGLSVMELVGALPLQAGENELRMVSAGEAIQIFAPEPAPERGAAASNVYVTLGKLNAVISGVVTSNRGTIEKLTVRSDKLSPDMIGGVACDQKGATVGIVDSIEGNNATILSASIIRAATERVLETRGNVPRPLLGVRGQAVEEASQAAFLSQGWREDDVRDLIKDQVGILLTSVSPRSPAATAKLQPGDVILSVNGTEVKDAEQFSRLLQQSGSGAQLDFMVRRPAVAAPVSMPVTLGGSFAPIVEWHFDMPRGTAAVFGLQQLGIQTMALTPQVAAQMGALNGLMVVAVKTEGAAARAGIREGDVIESIDGRAIGRSVWTNTPAFARRKKYILTIVRNREKKQIPVETIE